MVSLQAPSPFLGGGLGLLWFGLVYITPCHKFFLHLNHLNIATP